MINNKIEEIASKILLKHNEVKAPINLRKIILSDQYDIEIKEELFDEVTSGILMIKEERSIIGIKSTDSHKRQNFSLGHEFGHYILHSSRQQLFVDTSKSVELFFRSAHSNPSEDRKEREANAFAAALLMPKYLIEKNLEELSEQKLSPDKTIESLALIFDVSQISMTHRLTNLNLIG